MAAEVAPPGALETSPASKVAPGAPLRPPKVPPGGPSSRPELSLRRSIPERRLHTCRKQHHIIEFSYKRSGMISYHAVLANASPLPLDTQPVPWKTSVSNSFLQTLERKKGVGGLGRGGICTGLCAIMYC